MSHLELGELLLETGDGHSWLVLALSEISREDLNRVGSKAATLGELLRSGFAVPEGYVLTTTAFRSFTRENKLTEGR